MRITRMFAFAATTMALGALQASAQPRPIHAFYQGRRGREQSDAFSRKIKLGRDGRVGIQNISGQITVTAGPGDEVSIDVVKRTRGDRSQLGRVDVVIDEHAGRVDVRTDHRSMFRDDDVSVDYTVVVPESAAVELRSVSGNISVTGVKGSVREQSISGNVATSNTPRAELAKTVSGNVDLAGISTDSDVSASSISGNVHINGIKARSLDVNTVSGEVWLRDARCERLTGRSISGNVEYSGSLVKNGRYEVNSHSGGVRFSLAGNTGFEMNAASFSGSVRSEYPMTTGGQRSPEGRGRRGFGNRMQATFGDGSASITLRTFSGDIALLKTTNK